MDNSPLTYAESGVSIEAQDTAIAAFKQLVEATHGSEVLSGVGSFGAAFAPDLSGVSQPVFVSSTDGVGTKVKLHARFETHGWAGRDLVSAVVNDVIVNGARPLFFLDYIACNTVSPDVIRRIVGGMAEVCSEIGCALIGGEIAEMGDVYQPGDYDLAGFSVGMADRKVIEDAPAVRPGDAIVGIASSGIHCNGFSLVRRVFEGQSDRFWLEPDSELGGKPKDIILAPTLCYAPLVAELQQAGLMKTGVHISGGGLVDNVPRVLPAGLAAEIRRGKVDVLPVFDIIQRLGHVEPDEMWHVFNMGVGFCIICSSEDTGEVVDTAASLGLRGYSIGTIAETAGSRQTIWVD